MIRPGQLRHRATIQNMTKVADGMGGFTETYVTFATRQAAIWNHKGKEKIINGKLTEETIWNVRIRFLDGINSGMRIIVGSDTFEILSVASFELRRIYQDLSCKKVD